MGDGKSLPPDFEGRLQEAERRHVLLRILTVGLVLVTVMVASSLPLLIVARMVEQLAGRNTSVNVLISVSVAMSFTFALSLAGAAIYIRSLRKALREAQQRIKRLQEQLERRQTSGGRRKR